jgi:hypothetical protein
MGRTERDFLAGARAAGFDIKPGATRPWLTVYGHLEPSLHGTVAEHVIARLREMFITLGGDERLLASKRAGASPRPDACYQGRILEVDEIQHFTTDRLRTLELYPAGTRVGFDVDRYRSLCSTWASRGGDKYRAYKQTVEFPHEGGRRAQRAYFDACRDLLAPYFGDGPVVRVPAPECEPALALQRFGAEATT